MLLKAIFIGTLILSCSFLMAQPAPVAATPPMGWNSWNHFAGKVTDADVRATADILVSSGMRDAGYVYVNIDDTWEGERDAQGNIQSNSKFPDMKALGDYVHSKGLKLGIYSSPGTKTCAGYPGTKGYEYQDARQYAAWGVDYLKYDWCNVGTQDAKSSYTTMSDALRSTGRPIVFSMCEWGTAKPWLLGRECRQPVADHRRHLGPLARAQDL